MAMRASYTVAVALLISARAIDAGGASSCAAGNASPECTSHEEHSLMQVPPAQQLIQSESADWPARVSGAMHSVTFTLPNVSLHLPNISVPGSASLNNVTSRIAAGVGNVTSRIADAVHLPNISNVHLPGVGLVPGANVSEAEAESALGVNGSQAASPPAPDNSTTEAAPASEATEDLAANAGLESSAAEEVLPATRNESEQEPAADEDHAAEATPPGLDSSAAEDVPPATRNVSEQEPGELVDKADAKGADTGGESRTRVYVTSVAVTSAVFMVGFALHSYLTAAGTLAAAA